MSFHSPVRRFAVVVSVLATLLLVGVSEGWAADYVPGQVVVGYSAGPLAGSTAARMGIRAVAATPAPGVQVLRLSPGVSVAAALSRLRHRPGVQYAVPNYIAHAAGSYLPDDPGRVHAPEGWEALQWNFMPGTGVDAPGAWANLIADGRPGGRGVVVAILDTGIAYRNWHQFRMSPDFAGTRFVDPYDFVSGNRYPLDREGHGTFVAGTIAEATNNGIGLTGLAYGATIMPVRVLDASGAGDAATISRGIRYAVTHGAQVINLSLEFDMSVTAADIPDIVSAINYAHRRGAVVVAASGNDSREQLAYPARTPAVISVGATTRDRCLADYSNGGRGLDLVAPGGGDDASLADTNCNPDRNLPGIFQMTFPNTYQPGRFGLPGGWYGTSMAAPHVAGVAALVIASGVLGPHPSPDQILARLEQTAQPLGGTVPNDNYGYGLVDAATATAPVAAVASHRR
jgi:serine protease